jgi:hypothetical protein
MAGLKLLCAHLSQALTLEFDAVSAMEDAIQDGIGKCWVVQIRMPQFGGELTGYSGPQKLAFPHFPCSGKP